jgi:hypothetical protein
LDYPADDYAQLLTTPIQMQAEANGGFSILGNFFFASSVVNPWDKLFQLRNFNLETADALHLQIQIYQSDTAANYRFQIWKDGSACSGDFAKPATDNAWIAVDLQYDTGTDKWELKLNDVLVAQATCQYGWLENFQLNRVIVASQNWAGLRLYDSLLTDAEVASELDKICVPADTCADVLTAGCDSAPACPLTCSETLVSEWKFNNDFADSQGIYPLTATGISFVDGRYGEAATLDNDSDMLRTTNDFAPLTSTSKQTYSFWVKRSEVDDKLHHVFAQSRVRSDGNEWGVYFKPTPSNTLVVYVFGDPGLESATQFSDTNTWNHFIVTVDEGVFSLYQNGILEGTKTMSIGSISGPLYYTPDSILGNIGRFFPRLALDNFRFYNAVLSVSVVAACEASLTCSDNTYATSGAVLAFNPTAASETFGNNIARETSAFYTNLGPRTFDIAENGGFTAVFKVNFGASMSVYESVFALADGDAGSNVKTNAIHCQGSYQTSNSYFSCKIYDQATVQCKIDGNSGTVTPNTDHSVVFRYDLASNQLYLKTDDSVKTQACSSAPQHSRTLPNTLLGRTWSSGSAQLNGNIFGLYAFDKALSDAESQQVLDGIVIGASDSPPQLECTPCPTDGTVVAGCSGAAASPQNITFLVSAGNVSAAALAPYHAGILTAVSTALNTAASHLSIASVADTAHNAANLRLVAANVPGADVDALSQKTDEVAAAVKDAVNSAAGGSAVVCAANAATILSSGANLTVYC